MPALSCQSDVSLNIFLAVHSLQAPHFDPCLFLVARGLLIVIFQHWPTCSGALLAAHAQYITLQHNIPPVCSCRHYFILVFVCVFICSE